ncbi:MAG: aminotransferase class V-fold PLP-dependent enzyme [Phycisphaerales bacterium]|nr:aminotransferase class V-fold PLP-dependent enzyme [Phycisphaerales bacterium]
METSRPHPAADRSTHPARDPAPDLDSPPEPLAADLASRWLLDPAITFLNHGSFGAVPRDVFDAHTALRLEIERHPVECIDRQRHERLLAARSAVGAFIGARPEDLGFVTNATGGVNAVLRSLALAPGDELLTTTHVYNAVRQTMRHIADVHGAGYREVHVPLPVRSADEIVDAIMNAVTERTRLLVVDQVTSATALVLPVERIVRACAEREVDVLVDGAHGPGMVEVDLRRLGCAYYTANLHKWVCAPKGAAILWVRPDRQAAVHPNTISHFYETGFAAEFEWQGTRDLATWLTVPAAIDFMGALGWDRVRAHNHAMVTWAQRMICARWGTEPASPPDGSLLGSMVTLAAPKGLERFATSPEVLRALYHRHHVEAPVVDWDGRRWLRVSAQVYNTPGQYEHFADAVLDLARHG